MAKAKFRNLNEFYHKLYKHEHRQRGTRLLHVAGTCLGAAQFAAALAMRRPQLLLTGLLTGYSCAWASHFFIEHNRPATFKYPLMSFLSDFIMAFNIITGREGLDPAAAAEAAADDGDGDATGAIGGTAVQPKAE